MRATSPGGSVAYENTVSWSGELGYGVRPAEQGQVTEMTEANADMADTDDHGHGDDHGDGH